MDCLTLRFEHRVCICVCAKDCPTLRFGSELGELVKDLRTLRCSTLLCVIESVCYKFGLAILECMCVCVFANSRLCLRMNMCT